LQEQALCFQRLANCRNLASHHEITSSRRSGISHVVTRIHPSKAPKVDHDSAIGLVLDDVTATGARDELETYERSFETHESIRLHRQLIEALPVGENAASTCSSCLAKRKGHTLRELKVRSFWTLEFLGSDVASTVALTIIVHHVELHVQSLSTSYMVLVVMPQTNIATDLLAGKLAIVAHFLTRR